MNKFRFTIKVLAIAIFTFAFASMAQAQASRTWVSGVGDDANPCSRTAPCKTFAGAISKTAACGEIDALDPGGFGAVTITKSITIDGSGTFASILASLVSGIVINANATTDVITIRGISINGFCNGIHGINILAAKTVNVEDCAIFRFSSGNGITANDPGGVNLNVRNTVIRDNTLDGINATSASGNTNVTLDRVSLIGNANGLHARSGTRATARNCVFSNNTANGVFSDAAGASLANAFVWESQISFNGGAGVRAGNAGNVGTSGATIAQNQIDRNTGNGVLISTGGVVNTFSNNSILGNGADGCAGCTPVGPGN
ncbi:MAG TPA: right-handed parallel beta-helix repeat-containing protein [Pyrinomonadaceae bacterium]|nr:right-handed parallel beta-helix repeat-containing protein [Pyrinomonadaceae bacterium]